MDKETKPFSETAVCGLCGGRVKVGGLTRHLASCRKAHPAKPGKKAVTTYTLKVCGRYLPKYFLYLELTDNMTLDDLDLFLRGIWLECCGHLSQFIIKDEHYSASPEADVDLSDFGMPEDKDSHVGLGEILAKGMTFGYEYDFGSTTHLSIKVVGVRQGTDAPLKKPIVLARNDPPAWTCADCGKPAVRVDSLMGYGIGNDNVFCATCARKRENTGDCYFLNIANSPRTGVCAYE